MFFFSRADRSRDFALKMARDPANKETGKPATSALEVNLDVDSPPAPQLDPPPSASSDYLSDINWLQLVIAGLLLTLVGLQCYQASWGPPPDTLSLPNAASGGSSTTPASPAGGGGGYIQADERSYSGTKLCPYLCPDHRSYSGTKLCSDGSSRGSLPRILRLPDRRRPMLVFGLKYNECKELHNRLHFLERWKLCGEFSQRVP